MNRFSIGLAAAFLAALSFATPAAQSQAPAGVAAAKPARNAPVEMTVDSIMRGPDLVGYPPGSLRWSADSTKLYFSWRKPGEEESSTYMVERGGGEPRKLSEEEAKNAPPANGQWDKARKRMLFTDGGDIVIYDADTGTRRQVTKTSGSEGNPRWARKLSVLLRQTGLVDIGLSVKVDTFGGGFDVRARLPLREMAT